jgi:hypothetical protein
MPGPSGAAEEVEEHSKHVAVAVDEDGPVVGVRLQHGVAAPEHAAEHRVVDAGQHGSRGFEWSAADVELDDVVGRRRRLVVVRRQRLVVHLAALAPRALRLRRFGPRYGDVLQAGRRRCFVHRLARSRVWCVLKHRAIRRGLLATAFTARRGV